MNIKKRTVKAVVCILTFCLLVPMCLLGCAGSEKTLMSLEGHKFSENLYQLMLTQQKGMMAYSVYSQYGNYNSEKFWGMTIDMATQKTNAEYYDELVLERAKNYLSAMVLFDELTETKEDFNFPKEYEENIDLAIQNMIEVDAKGSKTTFNSMLFDYGINEKMLREYLIMDAKATYVMDYLYGSDGSKIGDAVKTQYYNENYVSCRRIIIHKYYYVYETDEDNVEIYFDPQSGKPVYDTTKNPKYNSDGTTVTDKYGNRIYYDDSGKIAYDKVNGVRKVMTDELTNTEITQGYSEEKINSLREKSKQLAADADGKGLNYFEALRVANSDDYSASDKSNGNMFFDVNINFSSYTSKLFDDICDSLEKMQVGDIKLIEDDYAFMIIIKTELEADAWNKEQYVGSFKDEIYGVTDFINNLKAELYDTRLAGYRENIKIDTEVLDSIDFSISNVVPNYYYPDPNVAYYLYTQEDN